MEKLGFVPNVLRAYAFDAAKLKAFIDMVDDLMLADSGLDKLEREMIAVAVSAVNHCHYCLTAHGAAVRQRAKDPELGELIAQNYRAADLSPRRKAMLDFAVKLTETPDRIEETDRAGAARRRLLRSRHLGHRGGHRVLQHVEPHRGGDRHAPEPGVPLPAAREAGQELIPTLIRRVHVSFWHNEVILQQYSLMKRSIGNYSFTIAWSGFLGLSLQDGK